MQTVVAEPWFKVSDAGLVLEGPAFDRGGNLLFCDVFGRRVLRLTPDRRLSTVVGLDQLGPGGVAVHKDGRIFIAAMDLAKGIGSLLAVKPDGSGCGRSCRPRRATCQTTWFCGCYILLNVRWREYCRNGESLGGPMARRAKPTGRLALCALTYLLCATGIGIGLTGCVVPGTSTFVMKPERIVPPPSQKIARPAASDGSEQNSRGEPRRELVFPKTSDLPSPRVKK